VNNSKIGYIAGIVAQEPVIRESRIGDLMNVRVAVTVSYPQDGAQYGETDWYDVVVKHKGLQASAMRELYKGAKIVAQGNIQEKPNQQTGKLEYTLWADRIGLVEYLRRDQVPEPTTAAGFAAASIASAADELGF